VVGLLSVPCFLSFLWLFATSARDWIIDGGYPWAELYAPYFAWVWRTLGING